MPPASTGSAWSPLHDLALVYLALMHGADAEIDPVESKVTSEKLRSWYPEEGQEQIERVMKEVMLMYVGGSSEQMLETSVASLREALPKGQRIAVLNDLADIASADGFIAQGEVSFIQQLAQRWEVDQDIR